MLGAFQWTESKGASPISPQHRIGALARAIDARPHDAWLYVEMGDVYAASASFAEAVRSYEQALEYDPRGFEAWAALIHCHLKLGRIAVALDLCDRNPRPDDAVWLRQRGLALLRLRRVAEGRAELARAIELGDAQLGALRVLLTSLARSADGGALLATCDRLDDRYRDTAGARGFRALALSLLGRVEEARQIVDLDRCVMRVPIEPPAEFGGITAFNHALAAEILSDPPVITQAGTNIHYGAHTRSKPVLTALRRMIREAAIDYAERRGEFTTPAALPDPPRRATLGCSTLVLRGSGRNGEHLHPAGYLSTVYHVAVPPGLLKRTDQRGALALGVCGSIAKGHSPCWGMRTIRAEPGWLTIFPSHIFHDVVPTLSSQPRISVVSDVIPFRPWASRVAQIGPEDD